MPVFCALKPLDASNLLVACARCLRPHTTCESSTQGRKVCAWRRGRDQRGRAVVAAPLFRAPVKPTTAGRVIPAASEAHGTAVARHRLPLTAAKLEHSLNPPAAAFDFSLLTWCRELPSGASAELLAGISGSLAQSGVLNDFFVYD
eukprot:6182998-Pleurochrysis_carterae.AAC.1